MRHRSAAVLLQRQPWQQEVGKDTLSILQTLPSPANRIRRDQQSPISHPSILSGHSNCTSQCAYKWELPVERDGGNRFPFWFILATFLLREIDCLKQRACIPPRKQPRMKWHTSAADSASIVLSFLRYIYLIWGPSQLIFWSNRRRKSESKSADNVLFSVSKLQNQIISLNLSLFILLSELISHGGTTDISISTIFSML
jgi:hypothetical protein